MLKSDIKLDTFFNPKLPKWTRFHCHTRRKKCLKTRKKTDEIKSLETDKEESNKS